MVLLLIGAGGHGRAVADLAKTLLQEVVFIDDGFPERKINAEWSIVGALKDVHLHDGPICVTVGNNDARETLWERFGYTRATTPLVHPSAVISTRANFGPGTVVMPGTIVNYGTSFGRGAIINTGAQIDHDCVLGDMVHVSPGAILAGGVTVGNKSWIGAGAVIIEKIHIGRDVVVGAGSVVIDNLPDSARVAGVPARPI